MYAIYTIRDTIRVPPKALGDQLNTKLKEIVQEDFQGLVDEDIGLVVSILAARKKGEGKVIPGDGMIYYDSEIDMLVYKPELHEVMEGTVTEITEFGVFVRTGPIEGLIHRSQIMDDFTNYDQKTQTFVGRDTKKKIGMSEDVLVRTVSISLKGSLSNSKIGYTMRQVGLGKKEWLKTDSKKPQAKEKSATEEKEEKPAKSGKSANKKSEKKK